MKARTRQRASAVALAAALATGAGAALAGPAGAATGPATVDASDSATDYAGYPANEVQSGCDAADVLGVRFYLNGAPAGGVATMEELGDLPAGAELAATWTGVTEECDGEAVSIALKEAPGPGFNATVDQVLVSPYARATLRIDADTGRVSLDLPTTRTCFYQADLVLGRPLLVVGPNGNFYSSRMGRPGSDDRSVLLGFNNGTQDNCTVETTTTTVPETTTTTAPTTTTQPTTTTTEPPTLTVPPPDGSTTTVPAITVRPQDSSTQITRTAARTDLPATGAGSATPWLAGASALLLAVGATLAGQGRRMTRRGL